MNRPIFNGSVWLYGFLLKFYPAPFRREYGEEMQFVFAESLSDALSGRGARGLGMLWGRTIVDAGKSLVIQHVENRLEGNSMETKTSTIIIRVALLTALILLIPMVGMLLGDSFNWGPMDFILTGVILFSAGLVFALLTRRAGNTMYRLAMAVAIGTTAILFFTNFALGVIGSDDERVNLMYVGVIGIGIIGSLIARFQSRGMARAMFVTAAAQASTIVIALAFGMHNYPGSSALEILMINGFFIVLWVVAGLLFRRAGESEYELKAQSLA